MPLYELKNIQDVKEIKVGRKGGSDPARIRLLVLLVAVNNNQPMVEITDFTKSFGNKFIRLNVLQGSPASIGLKDLLKLYPSARRFPHGKSSFLDNNIVVIMNITAIVYNGTTSFNYVLTDFKIVNKDPKFVLKLDPKHQLKLKSLVKDLNSTQFGKNISNKEEYQGILNIISRPDPNNDDDELQRIFKKPKMANDEGLESISNENSIDLAPNANPFFMPADSSSQFPALVETQDKQDTQDTQDTASPIIEMHEVSSQVPYTMVSASQDDLKTRSEAQEEDYDIVNSTEKSLKHDTFKSIILDDIENVPQSTQTQSNSKNLITPKKIPLLGKGFDEKVNLEKTLAQEAISINLEDSQSGSIESMTSNEEKELKSLVKELPVGSSNSKTVSSEPVSNPNNKETQELPSTKVIEESESANLEENLLKIIQIDEIGSKVLEDVEENEQEQEHLERLGAEAKEGIIQSSTQNIETIEKQKETKEQEDNGEYGEENVLEKNQLQIADQTREEKVILETEKESAVSEETSSHVFTEGNSEDSEGNDENKIQEILATHDFGYDVQWNFDGFIIGVDPIDFSLIGRSYQELVTTTNFRVIISNISRDRLKIFKTNKNCIPLEFRSKERILEFFGYDGDVDDVLAGIDVINKKLTQLINHRKPHRFRIVRKVIHLSTGRQLVWECLDTIQDILH